MRAGVDFAVSLFDHRFGFGQLLRLSLFLLWQQADHHRRQIKQRLSCRGITECAGNDGCVQRHCSGGQSGAEQGILTVMIGGDAGAFTRAEPVIKHYARAVTLMGEAGAGQKTKMVNQICVAGVVQGLAEGLAFAIHAGLDGKRVVDVISKGAATSWQMENRGKTMVDGKFDFGFAVDLMRKDLRIAMEAARSNGAQLPGTALIDQFYAGVQKQGGGKLDTSSLIKLLVQQ